MANINSWGFSNVCTIFAPKKISVNPILFPDGLFLKCNAEYINDIIGIRQNTYMKT